MKIKTHLAVIILLSVGFQACYEEQEGCLDIRAVNFDVDADLPCMDDQNCECIYPSINLTVLQRYYDEERDTFFKLGYVDSVYTDRNGKPFRINKITYYLSEIHLVREDGTEIQTLDTVGFNYYTNGGTTIESGSTEDNFALVAAGADREFSISTINQTGSFNRIRFKIGIDGIANQAIPATFPSVHPLRPQADSLYFGRDSGYVFNRIELFRDTIETDTIPLALKIGTPTYLKTITLDFPEPFFLDVGHSPLITLLANYQAWLEGIDRNDDVSTLIATIVDNITEETFQVIAVEQESE